MKELQDQINELRKEVTRLNSVSTLSRETESALKARGFLIPTVIGTPTATTVISSFPFNLPANPTKTLRVTFQGKVFEILTK